MATNEEKKSLVSRTLTSNEYEQIQGALVTLLAIVGSKDFSPDGTIAAQKDGETEVSAKLAETVLFRTALAVKAKQEEGTREVLIAMKRGVDAACHRARLATIESFREISKLSPTTRAMLGAKGQLPESTTVPLSEVVEFFPEGTSEDRMIELLHRSGFKLAQGKNKEVGKRLFVNIGKEAAEKYLSGEVANAAE